MVENPSSEPYFITNPELEEGIENGSITTFTIWEQTLLFYLKAATKSGFEVEVIANPGQYYITEQISAVRRRSNTNGQENKPPTITAVKSQSPVKESYVAISLKRPPGVTNDMAFHIARQKIQPA